MFKNNLISVIRSLWKSKTITLVNLIGLTLGLTVSILLIILVKHENSFDTFHKNKNTLYRVLTVKQEKESNKKALLPFTPAAFGENIKMNFSLLKDMVTVTSRGPRVRIGEVLFDEKTLYADNNFLKIFSFKMISGSSENALINPNSVVLTKTLAGKIYGDKDPVNEMITINKKAFKITGVIEDAPANSTLQFSALFSMNSFELYNAIKDSWSNNLTEVYLNLPASINRAAGENMINEYTRQFKPQTPFSQFAFQPLLRMHLYSEKDGIKAMGSNPAEGNITNLIIYTFFVFFILLTAIINFTNISFNQIYKKINEIGMRRILGASKMQVFLRSWLESFIICIVSFILSMIIVQAVLPEFNSLITRRIEFDSIIGSAMEIGLVLFAVSIFLGLIPALKLINMSNSQSIRRGINFSNSYKSVKGMLVVQFAIALFFLITTLLVSKQMKFINSTYNIHEDEDIIQVRNTRNEKIPKIESKIFFDNVSQNSLIKMSTYNESTGVRNASYVDDFEANGLKENCWVDRIEKGHFAMYNYKIKEGRAFDVKTFPSDTVDAVMVNETFVKRFNINNPINTIIHSANKNYKIVGVVEDYAMADLKSKINPLVLKPAKNINNYYFKIARQNEKAALDMIKAEWKKHFPSETMNYLFYNESVLKDYNNEITSAHLFQILSILSISLSLLGVVGLSSLMLVKRKKEIAIRKILGASMQNLIFHFSKEFSYVIAAGFVIAGALSYYYIEKFLEDFVYKTTIDSVPFILSLVIVMAIVFGAITVQSLKALFANPVDAIKNE